jgi:azurin
MKLMKPVVLACCALLSAPLLAQECETEIEGNDMIQYNKQSITVPASCKEFKVTLKHVGKLPVNTMGHNWVLTTTADMQAVASDAMAAGPNNKYLKPDDTRILAHTDMIGGGETDSVTFEVSKLDAAGEYTYFCSFPGHSSIMKGTLKVEK